MHLTRPSHGQTNVARNQNHGVTQQLNDGIRKLSGQAHVVNGTLYYCHTSCDLLNASTVKDYLRVATIWVEAHPLRCCHHSPRQLRLGRRGLER
jgi:hypothetical protein